MSTIRDIRHANLLLLIEQAGSTQALADQLEKSHSQISQLRNQSVHSGTGKPRTVGDDLAREIEQKLRLPKGWMDNPIGPSDDSDAGRAGMSLRAASIASRLDALEGDRQARAFALIDLALRTVEAEAASSSASTSKRSRKA